jgi:hypothetical protein
MYSGMNVFLAERVCLYIRAKMKECKGLLHSLKVSLSSALLMTRWLIQYCLLIAHNPYSRILGKACLQENRTSIKIRPNWFNPVPSAPQPQK